MSIARDNFPESGGLKFNLVGWGKELDARDDKVEWDGSLVRSGKLF